MSKCATIEEIRKLSRRSRLILYGDKSTPAATASFDDAQNDTIATIKPRTEDQIIHSDKAKLEPISDRSIKTTKPLKNALRIIRAQSEHGIPFLFRHEASLLGQVKGGASVIEAEKEAMRHNLIVKHILPRAKTNACFWEITNQGYDWLKRMRPMWGSKGKYKHKFCVHRIEHTYQKRSYHSKIEERRPNGKLVDLCLSKDDYVLYVEVCASWPIEKELTNILKDLEGDPLPSEIILAVAERKMIKPLEQAISEVNAGAELSRPVKVVLAGDMIDFLEIPK